MLWVVPAFDQLRFTGTHSQTAVSAVDLLLPHLISGDVAVLAEALPAPFEKLLQRTPALRAAIEVLPVEPLDEAATLDVAAQWAAQVGDGEPVASGAVLAEAWQLASQFGGSASPPGSVLTLLERSHQQSDFFPIPFHIPIAIDTLQADDDYRIRALGCLGAKFRQSKEKQKSNS